MKYLTKKDIYFLGKAGEISKLSDFENIHIGCVAVYNGRIISIGYNSNQTHPIQKKYNNFRDLSNPVTGYIAHKIHAETMCLINIKNNNIKMKKVKLYICRYKFDNNYGMARPCVGCMNLIKKLNIRNIYYTIDNGYVYEYIK